MLGFSVLLVAQSLTLRLPPSLFVIILLYVGFSHVPGRPEEHESVVPARLVQPSALPRPFPGMISSLVSGCPV